MNARRLVSLGLSVVFFAAILWVVLDRGPKGPPPPTPRLAPPVLIQGRVLDEGGVPVPDASVQLFEHAEVWLDGADAGCATSLLACNTLWAGRQVLLHLDAGTLVFPDPLAKTSTDGEGRFTLGRMRSDLFVAASDGQQGAVERVPDDGVLLLRFLVPVDPVGLNRDPKVPGEVSVISINPFTREISRGDFVPANDRAWWWPRGSTPPCSAPATRAAARSSWARHARSS